MKLKDRLRYLPFWLLALLPMRVLHFCADILSFILYSIIGYRKSVVLNNLKIAFPDRDQGELEMIRKAFYRHFTDIFIESIKLLSMSESEARQRVELVNVDEINQLYEAQKSIIVYAGHIGNWEWMAVLPFHIKHTFLSFYQQQSNAYFNQLMIILRERFGNKCIESKTGYKTLKAYADQEIGTLTYVIGDQRPGPNSTGRKVPFFGRDTPFLTGADRMALKLDQEVFYAHMTQVKRGYYRVKFIPLDKDKDLIAQFATCLEANIKEQPEQWLWSHKRWKGIQ